MKFTILRAEISVFGAFFDMMDRILSFSIQVDIIASLRRFDPLLPVAFLFHDLSDVDADVFARF